MGIISPGYPTKYKGSRSSGGLAPILFILKYAEAFLTILLFCRLRYADMYKKTKLC